MSFGSRLKDLRVKKNITQQEVADFIGVGRATIAGYETKGKNPDFDKLRLIAKFFNVTTDYLLEVDDDSEKDLDISNTHIVFGDDLPDKAREYLNEYMNYLRAKYKDTK